MDTSDGATRLDVVHDAARRRYEGRLPDGTVASLADYVDTRALEDPPDAPPTVRRFTHTETRPRYGGLGFAAQVVRYALDDAVAAGMRIAPSCSYVAKFLADHKDWADHVVR